MARQKIGEYKAKKLLFNFLGLPYSGFFYDSPTADFKVLDTSKTYVVKVDEGVKKRFKKGLIKLNVKFADLPNSVKELQNKGFHKFLIEEYKEHTVKDERYLALVRNRDGINILVSQIGGVDIEDHQDQVKNFLLASHNLEEIADYVGLSSKVLQKIVEAFNTYHFSFLEINPLVVNDNEILFLDLAVEVDSAGEFFLTDGWSGSDFINSESGELTEEEKNIVMLSDKSQASFRLVVLNPNGAIWMLLSGGGASIVVADEVHNEGLGKELANYGEYSGNPNAEETYLYTKNLLSLMLKSKARKKTLIIAGGVANFTDIRITFAGIINALEEVKDKLQSQKIKVFVRRGGPYEKEGLKMMEDYLRQSNLLGEVSGPEMVLTEVVTKAVKEIKNGS